MKADPRRIVVTESCCFTCDSHAIQVYHQSFPELRVEGSCSEQAVDHLADRLTAALDNVSDPLHREVVRIAIEDARAFLDREVAVHVARGVTGAVAR